MHIAPSLTGRDRRRTSGAGRRRPGRAMIQGHWGELLQGSFRDRDGAIVRALVTLRSPLFATRARFVPAPGPVVTVQPDFCHKARLAVENTLAYLGVSGEGGHLGLENSAPAGIGAGSSTTDVVAAIVAVTRACHQRLTGMEIAALAVETEKAVDPIMLPARPEILFAHRQGTVIESFDNRLPQLQVVAFTDGAPIDTLSHPPARYCRSQVDMFEALRDRLRRAIATGDRSLLGEVATQSAVINQSYLPKPSLDRLIGIMRDAGALGLSVSHSGSAVGLLFDPGAGDAQARLLRARRLLAEAGIRHAWTFVTGGPR